MTISLPISKRLDWAPVSCQFTQSTVLQALNLPGLQPDGPPSFLKHYYRPSCALVKCSPPQSNSRIKKEFPTRADVPSRQERPSADRVRNPWIHRLRQSLRSRVMGCLPKGCRRLLNRLASSSDKVPAASSAHCWAQIIARTPAAIPATDAASLA